MREIKTKKEREHEIFPLTCMGENFVNTNALVCVRVILAAYWNFRRAAKTSTVGENAPAQK